jgi:hypothetical protein
MARTKHGSAVAKALQQPTRQDVIDELNEVCEAAKKAKTEDAYKEAHSWMNDLLTELEKHKTAGQ